LQVGISDNLSDAYSVCVSGDNVYVAGYVRYGSEIATLWVNGVAQQLSYLSSAAMSVFVSGDDVYVAGHVNSHATVWKNCVHFVGGRTFWRGSWFGAGGV
jgi:hypothetical protein